MPWSRTRNPGPRATARPRMAAARQGTSTSSGRLTDDWRERKTARGLLFAWFLRASEITCRPLAFSFSTYAVTSHSYQRPAVVLFAIVSVSSTVEPVGGLLFH